MGTDRTRPPGGGGRCPFLFFSSSNKKNRCEIVMDTKLEGDPKNAVETKAETNSHTHTHRRRAANHQRQDEERNYNPPNNNNNNNKNGKKIIRDVPSRKGHGLINRPRFRPGNSVADAAVDLRLFSLSLSVAAAAMIHHLRSAPGGRAVCVGTHLCVCVCVCTTKSQPLVSLALRPPLDPPPIQDGRHTNNRKQHSKWRRARPKYGRGP